MSNTARADGYETGSVPLSAEQLRKLGNTALAL